MPTLDDAINAIRLGHKDEGRQLLEELLEAEENNEQIWFWLSTVVDTDDDREICLENVLALNPNHLTAKQALDAVREGNFEAATFIAMALDETAEDDEEETPESGSSFRDQFFAESEKEDFGDEIEWPSVMGGAPEPKIKQKKEESKKSKKSGLNSRVMILGVVGLLLCLVLGGVAAYVVFGGGASGPGDEQPLEPAGPAEATATPTPEPTPTPTNTPLLLPTAKPTDLPTPTPTQVVSPTPPRADEAKEGG
jgi:hypothetical protein